MFRLALIQQFEKLSDRFEIEENTIEKLSVWDNEDKKFLEFKFDAQGNITDIY